jgi:biofilm PGA synthesis lipoprotein PgaB
MRAPVLLFLVVLIAGSFAGIVAADDSAVVLMYHRFGEDRYPSTSIRIDQFEAQLEYLRDQNYTVIPLAELLDALRNDTTLPARAVVITIDDAYRSVYEVGYPRLKAAGYPFTVFVATDPVDDGLADFMSWEQMREMAAGGATYANHGAAHRSVVAREASLDETARLAAVREDLERGWKRLSAELDPLPGVFAYPYGEFDLATAELVADAGYIAFGQQSGAVARESDRRALPRFPMAENFADIDGFRTKVASLPLPVTTAEPWDPVTSERRPRVTITLSRELPRWQELACFIGGHGRIDVQWLTDGRRFTVGPKRDFGTGRHRVNCTAPGPSGRYYWFSHPWLIRDAN